MPFLERAHPATTCQPDHHPHRMICGDVECDCVLDDGRPFTTLDCCVDGQDWPCQTKRRHVAERRG